jgi:uncharacterized protein (DUF849 family)
MRAPEPLIINLALTGMVPTKEQTPHVPLTCDEILEDVAACRELGVSMIHVHARDAAGVPTQRADTFAPIVRRIRALDPELVVVVTCSGRSDPALDSRAEVLTLTGDAKPDMASLTLGSNNFPTQASVNAPDVIRGLAERMAEHAITPELEVFEPGMLAYGRYLQTRGLVPDPGYVNIILGGLGTAPLSPAVVGTMIGMVPDGWTWALGGIGRFQLDANLVAVAMGGHVRTGLEDNIWFDRERRVLATNETLVRRIVDAAAVADRPIATPAQTRARLGLQ